MSCTCLECHPQAGMDCSWVSADNAMLEGRIVDVTHAGGQIVIRAMELKSGSVRTFRREDHGPYTSGMFVLHVGWHPSPISALRLLDRVGAGGPDHDRALLFLLANVAVSILDDHDRPSSAALIRKAMADALTARPR